MRPIDRIILDCRRLATLMCQKADSVLSALHMLVAQSQHTVSVTGHADAKYSTAHPTKNISSACTGPASL